MLKDFFRGFLKKKEKTSTEKNVVKPVFKREQVDEDLLKELWKGQVNSSITIQYKLFNDIAVVNPYLTALLYSIDMKTGKIVWEHEPFASNVIFMEKVENYVLVVTQEGAFYFIQADKGNVIWKNELLQAIQKTYLKEIPGEIYVADVFMTSVTIREPVLLKNNIVTVLCSWSTEDLDGFKSGETLHAFSLEDGTELWHLPVEEVNFSLIDSCQTAVITAFHEIKDYGESKVHLSILDIETGDLLVKKTLIGQPEDYLIKASDELFFIKKDENINAYNTQSKKVWGISEDFDRMIVDGSRLFLTSEDKFYLVDIANGSLIWTYQPKTICPFIITENNIGVIDNDWLISFSKDTGQLNWKIPLKQKGQLQANDDFLLIDTLDEIYLVNISTERGKVTSYKKKENTRLSPYLINDKVLLCTSEGYYIALQ